MLKKTRIKNKSKRLKEITYIKRSKTQKIFFILIDNIFYFCIRSDVFLIEYVDLNEGIA